MGFTRKEAEHLLTLPESMLEKLGLITDKSIIEHYVKGWDVEVGFCKGLHLDKPIFEFSKQEDPSFYSDISVFWRKAEPPEIEIFGVKVRCNPPMSEEPKEEDAIFVLSTTHIMGYITILWKHSCFCMALLKRGICFKQEEDAKKVAQALFEDLQ